MNTAMNNAKKIKDVDNIKATLMVSFTLIFKTAKDAVAYINELKNFQKK